jgi:hypothetical protein
MRRWRSSRSPVLRSPCSPPRASSWCCFALIGLGAFAALNRWHSKLTVVYVMAAAGIIGVVLQHTVV